MHAFVYVQQKQYARLGRRAIHATWMRANTGDSYHPQHCTQYQRRFYHPKHEKKKKKRSPQQTRRVPTSHLTTDYSRHRNTTQASEHMDGDPPNVNIPPLQSVLTDPHPINVPCRLSYHAAGFPLLRIWCVIDDNSTKPNQDLLPNSANVERSN